jgi:hypothetical protein
MHFKERNLQPYAKPISATELKEGSIYFSVNYVDDELLIPTVGTFVFIGRDLEPGDSGRVYFQDIDSYRRGVRYSVAAESDFGQFSVGSENEVGHLFEFEEALEELMRCSLRRREKRDEAVANTQ